MPEYITLIIGIITGGLGTTVYSKWAENKSKQAEYNRELDKTYFLSKIKAAIEIYAQFTALLGSLHHIIILLKTIRDPRLKLGDETMKGITQDNLAEQARKGFLKAEELSTIASNSFGLFFTGANEEEFMKVSEEVHLMLLNFDATKNYFSDSEDLYLDRNLPEDKKQQVEAYYNESLKLYINFIDELIGKYHLVYSFVKVRMKELHDYFKKYDNY